MPYGILELTEHNDMKEHEPPVEQKTWDMAAPILDKDPGAIRQDQRGRPMLRDSCNRRELGGWEVDDDGNAVAYQVTGKPVIGDALLSSARPIWHLPEQVRC